MSMTYVYRVFDGADRLLYVGCSRDPLGRMWQHLHSSCWYPFHVRTEEVGYATRKEALEAETHAILTEFPRWNIEGRAKDHPDGYCTSIRTASWLSGEVALWQEWKAQRRERAEAIKRLNYFDRKVASTNALIDLISGGEPQRYQVDYDLDGPISAAERRRRAMAELRLVRETA